MKYTWLVEKYLEGELEGKELREFELEILRNPEVAAEVERIRELTAFAKQQYNKLHELHALVENYDNPEEITNEFILEQEFEGLKIRIVSEEEREFQDFKRKVRKVMEREPADRKNAGKFSQGRKTTWLVAASIAAILTFGTIALLTLRHSADLLALYSEYYQPYKADLILRDLSQEETNTFRQGLLEYSQANYGHALELFNLVQEGPGMNISIYLFRGICYMEMNDPEKAIESFNLLTGDKTLDDYAFWYRGLCYLKINDTSKAKENFNRIIEENGYYKEMAKEILKSL